MQKHIYYNDLKFTRDNKTGYYLNSTIRKRLHRYVWECEKGAIPKGYEIHHKDHNKSNNDISNLELLSRTEHLRIHAEEMSEETKQKLRDNLDKNARPKASEWHKSAKGRQWHKEHYERMKEQLQKTITKECDNCGREYKGKIKSRFCSNKCKSAFRRKQGLDLVERKCLWCGATFKTNKYRENKTCSRKCSGKVKNENC